LQFRIVHVAEVETEMNQLAVKRIILAFAVMVVIAAMNAFASEGPSGWTVSEQNGGPTCRAEGPNFAGATLFLVASSSALVLGISAGEFQEENHSTRVSVQIDHGPAEAMNGIAGDKVIWVSVSKNLSDRLDKATSIRIATASGNFNFPGRNIGKAMDATLKCAHGSSRAEMWQHHPEMIADGSPWMIMPEDPLALHLPPPLLKEPSSCTIRRREREVETILLQSQFGKLILAEAGPDMFLDQPDEVDTGLKIDDDPPRQFKALHSGNIVFVLIERRTMVERLRRAKSICWTLPSGKYCAAIDGIGDALAALDKCQMKRSHKQGN
jgi:hypothetical protein